ncbi:MAG: exodeoxyribonuclease V subunit alpha, partial [Balneolaceae bacterium]|nr:exodeoxyribonuclease V subunit alpha [Balneolaceae bacterium]
MSKGAKDEWFDEGIKHGWIEQYEKEAVRFLEREFGALNGAEKLSVVFTSLFLKAGHTALPLSRSPRVWASQLDIGSEITRKLPDTLIIESDFKGSKIAAGPDEITPLILEGGMVAFRKNRVREKRTLEKLRLMNRLQTEIQIIPDHKELAEQLFPKSQEHPDWQKVAVALSLIKPFLIISGGPGTGKTTTVARILVLHQRLHKNKLRIALAAPTGKAAGRMGEALQNELKNFGLTPEELDSFPSEAKTVHRLLSGTNSRGLLPPVEKKKLRYDLIIVDEASMIDLNLMYRLLQHLSDDTQLILLGDKDQLASVEAGSVFADLCKTSKNEFTPKTAEILKRMSVDLPEKYISNGEIDDSIVYLTKSYRFDVKSGIGTMASLVKDGDSESNKLSEVINKFDDLDWQQFQFSGDDIKSVTDLLIQHVQSAAGISEPSEMIAHWKKTAWLTVLRHGLTGSNRLNQLVEERIGTKRAVRMEDGWYHGRPVIITQNDYNLGVFNGDLGVCLRDENGKLWVYVETGSQLKRIHPKRITTIDPAYFLTVHKSQGSEFERVNLL